MSYFKSQLKDWLAQKDVDCNQSLAIGCQSDDRQYFRSFKTKSHSTADISSEFNPDYIIDLNEPVSGQHKLYNRIAFRARFDVITCLEVMEYLWNPARAHRNLFYLLEPGGSAYVSYPFLYPHHKPHGADFLRYTNYAIERFAKHANLKIAELVERHATALADLQNFYQTEGMKIEDPATYTYPIGYLVTFSK